MSEVREEKVVIIGGGLSGLVAGHELLKSQQQNPNKKFSFVVVEARDRVGGRTLSQVIGKRGAVMDLGGQWIGPNQKHVMELSQALGMKTFPQRTKGAAIWDVNNRITEREYPKLDTGFLMDILRVAEISFLSMKLTLAIASLPEENLFESDIAKKLDSMTCQQFFDENITLEGTKKLAQVVVRAVHGVEARDLSLLQFVIYAKQNGGLQKLIETEGANQDRKFIGGAQTLSKKLADILGDRVILGDPAKKVERTDDCVIVHTTKQTIKCDYVIIAMPPVISANIEFSPLLPHNRLQMMQRNFMGCIIKYIILYDKAFWVEKGFSGEVVHDGSDGLIFNVFDDTRPIANSDQVQPALVAFANADLVREWAHKTKEERKECVLKQLAKWFGKEALLPTDFIEQNWAMDEWSRGCPIATWGPGVLTSPHVGKKLREPVGRIHWCGTETATEGQGFLDGAVQAGKRVAKEILSKL